MASPMNTLPDKRIIIIAGPNGAGKTTFATEFLPNEGNCPTFINADLIATGLNPFQPERAAFQAGRMMLEMIDACVRRGETFAFETTLSGRGYARMIPRWQEQGYRVKLFFIRLPSADVAIERVRQRVAMGGHNIPEEAISRRFNSGWRNLQNVYKDLADELAIFGNGEVLEDPDVREAMTRATARARKIAIALTGQVITVRKDGIVYDTEP